MLRQLNVLSLGFGRQVNEFGTPQPPPKGQEELPALVQNECVTITPAVLHPGMRMMHRR